MTKENTLTCAPMAPLLDHLFNEASAAARFDFTQIPEEETTRMMHSKTEYLNLYSLLKHMWLPVSRETGKLLYMLARSTKATSVVEFGMSFGLSTLYLAAALRDNGGGKVITSEFEPTKVAKAREHFVQAGVSDLVEIRVGDALNTLAVDLPETIDLLILDGAKVLYDDILHLLESRFHPGTMIIADNASYNQNYLTHVRSAENGYLSVPFSDDVELSVRLR
ncbi:class I SAM-dependent methyltransferase [Rahnella sp. L72c]|uniref:Class I SAM-dependent methyltransferase n=1 Tax=Rahnella perminowiae TaxID=2816244 RepID=A0ABS6L588_9GAMM|nr:class I SAM-dependent methyltransferase [Rahnella perminowiae]MBU9836612.1 class I SAM-dependent methyltransferase [Rahnella perminowiae]